MTTNLSNGFRFLAFLLISSFSFDALAQKPFTINGKIGDLPDGTEIALMKNEGNLFSTVAIDTVKAGTFNFTGTVNELTDYVLIGQSPGFPSQWLDLWVKPGSKVSLTGSGKLLKTWKVKSNVAEQQDVARFAEASEKEMNQLQALSAQEAALFDGWETATTDQRRARKRGIDSLRVIQDSMRKLIDISDMTVLSASKKRGLVWMGKLKGLANSSKYNSDTVMRREVLAMYRSLPDASRNNAAGIGVYNILFPPLTVKIGEKIADTVLKSLDGKTHSLTDYKGKYILVDFWSIGCGPCISAMPEIKKVHQTMSDKVTVVSFSLDEQPETWKKGSEHVKMDWTNLSDGKGMAGLAAKYGVSGIPHYILISPEGILVDSWVGYSEGQLTSKLKALK